MGYVAIVDGGGGECVEVPCYCSYAIESNGQHWEETFDLDCRTSNEAEYMAVIKALEFIASEPRPEAIEVLIQSDSKLVVLQCKKRWRVKTKHLKPLRARVFQLVGQLRDVQFQWIPGKEVREVLGH
jgi:ribonuclease HI